jgi:hypothetical protein
MSKYHTLVIKGDLANHPRFVQIDGVDYEVTTSAEGHLAAKCEILEQFTKAQAETELWKPTASEETFMSEAEEAVKQAQEAKEGGYRD